MQQIYSLQIESSTACQGRCSFCPSGRQMMTRPKGQMSDDLFHKLVTEAQELDVKEVLLFKDGEPLLFPRLFEWLSYLEDRGIQTALFSNCALLTKEKADRLAQYTNIKFMMASFHGGDKAIYESMMGLNFEQTRDNVRYLISVARFPVSVYMMSVPTTRSSEPAFRQLWGDHSFINRAFFNWGGAIPNPDPSMEGTPQPCGRVLSQLQILHDGRAVLCCMDYDGVVTLGNANTEHIGSIWARAQAIRDRHLAYNFDMPLCCTCNLNKYK